MIFDKTPLPEDPTPSEAPPSYEDIRGAGSGASGGSASASVASASTTVTFRDTKVDPNGSAYPSPSSTSTITSPTIQSPNSANSYSSSSSSSYKGKGKAPAASSSSWWGYGGYGFGASRTTREVRTTVLSIIRDLVSVQNTGASSHSGAGKAASRSILESCQEACEGYSLSLSTLLQEKSIEGHTPLYWAIINRPPENTNDSDEDATTPNSESTSTFDLSGSSDLLTSFLSFSAPLIPSTISDIRNACLVTSDHAFFQRLRLSPEFSPLPGTDQMVLGATMSPDEVFVENLKGDEGSFAVNFKIPYFQKRMRVSKEVVVEFIARGRMWRLAFCTPENLPRHSRPRSSGSWCISLSLLENSPPTWIDSRIVISDASTTSHLSPGSSSTFASFIPGSSSLSEGSTRSPIIIRIQSMDQLIPPYAFRHPHQCREIVASLDDSNQGSSLQHAGSSYIGSDEGLKARLEARLRKPEAECIIC